MIAAMPVQSRQMIKNFSHFGRFFIHLKLSGDQGPFR